MLHLWDSIFYSVISFIPWTVTIWKQVQECHRIVCKCVLYIYFLFKVSNLSIFPGRPSSSVWNGGSGSGHVTLSHKPFVFCRPSVLCSTDASSKVHMIFLMESRRQARWQFLDASLHGTFSSRIQFQCFVTLHGKVCEPRVPMPAKLSVFMSAACTVELHWQVLQWAFKILCRTLMDDKNGCWSFQFFSSLSGSHLKIHFYYQMKKK